jgi:hypothetical protein
MHGASQHRAVLTTQELEENQIVASRRLAFSPELVASDFLLFGTLKGQFAGGTFESARIYVR